ncbi:LysR family transcriptional regulator [Companilactobacillus ginsenosidimutans]|uniref:LysR family transcriptional regulator n=1 Tax=Companilactobacillus ginsenosidimutans TaxID=1007676 RepID=A0A0H4QLK0_9LACO|nr:LysR family transcriptional regulator [Companilactobacillus ginsenosidimutans]AKP67583.1 LysR family transcriptional regulator [Companilactobacillus ginsenosidimutans]
MELRVLRYFQAVVREKNISRAADQLHVSQPAVSRQLRSLEEELGTTLFERGSRNIELTSSGEYFSNQVDQILSLTDKTLKNVQKNQDITGSIVIGAAETRIFLNVAQAINNLRTTYPHIQTNIISTDANEVRRSLKSGVFDFGVVVEPTNKDNYDFLTLPGESRWGLLVPNISPLAKQEHLSLEDLEDVDLIISRQTVSTDLIESWYGNSKPKLNIVATFSLIYNAALMVSAGIGYALCLDGIINTNQSDLTFVPLSPRKTSGASLVWSKGTRLSPAAEAFLNQLIIDLK